MLPVLVKRVKFGTKEFMFHRASINGLMRERDAIGTRDFERNPDRRRWLSNTIREMAKLVYFEKNYTKKSDSVVMSEPGAYRAIRKQKKESKKTRLKNFVNQKGLF